jgi:hypothetical protein
MDCHSSCTPLSRTIEFEIASQILHEGAAAERLALPPAGRWAAIMHGQRIEEAGNAEALVERAVAAANRAGQWRSWNFLTLQIQIAAGQWRPSTTAEGPTGDQPSDGRREEAPSDWKVIKSRIREPIPEMLLNWLDETRQVERCGACCSSSGRSDHSVHNG